VSEGKLTVEEATLLLQNLGREEPTPPKPPIAPEPPTASEPLVPAKPAMAPVPPTPPVPPLAPIRAEVDSVTRAKSVELSQNDFEIDELTEEQMSAMDGAEMENGFWGWIQQLISSFIPKEEFIEEYDWRFDPASISNIYAETTNGTIQMHGGEQNQILVHVRKVVKGPSVAAAKEFAERVQIIVEEEDGVLSIRKEHPKLSMRFQVEVAYEIKSPTRMNTELHTTNGKIDVDHIHGTLQTWTTNGKIELEKCSGQVQAGTTNGSVEVELAQLTGASKLSTTNGSVTLQVQTGNAPVEARTVNGSINLRVPANFSGHLEASTVNGKVDTDLPMTVKNVSRRHVAGQIGSGGDTTIQLHTVNGSVRLEKQAEIAAQMA
jgi:DUF4097 and DUF4098 domain-containing protein YvlB